MNNNYYKTIFKRKSFHSFKNTGNDVLEKNELDDILKAWQSFEPLMPEIKTKIRIVPGNKIMLKKDSEYCIMIYSEEKPNYLMNVGYLGEQLDLYLVEHNIGSLWFGLGRPDEKKYEGLSFVIMIAIHKVNDQSLFRQDVYKEKRWELKEIWQGDTLGIAEVARYAPSARNSQPWFVRNEGDRLVVFRYAYGKHPLVLKKFMDYNNRIDIGIFLCILEICMAEKNIPINRKLSIDKSNRKQEFTKVAEYTL